MQSEYLAKSKQSEGNIDSYVSNFTDSTVSMTLYIDHASKESAMVENLLNFYNVAFVKVSLLQTNISDYREETEIQPYLSCMA